MTDQTMALASTLMCPKCMDGKLRISEHIYCGHDVAVAACPPCGMYTIVGAPGWVCFPKWEGDMRVLGIGWPTNEEEKAQLLEFERLQQAATDELRALAEKVDTTSQAKL